MPQTKQHARPPILPAEIYQTIAVQAKLQRYEWIPMSAFRPEADIELKCV